MHRSLVMLTIVSGVVALSLMASTLIFDTEVEEFQHTFAKKYDQIIENRGKDRVSTTTILFVGDVMLARKVEVLSNQNGVYYPFSNLSLPPDYDYMIGNFEAVVPKVHQPTPYFKYAFSVSSTSVAAAKDFGFTHFGLANNHSYDFGESEYINTREVITDYGIDVFGDQKISTSTSVSYLETNAGTIALVGIHSIDILPDINELSKLTEEVAANSDKQFAYVHWGVEYEPTHSELQRELASNLVALGYDLVVGHHPHVVQNVDMIDGVPVFYSLGNFIFDQYFSADVQQGLMLKLSLGEKTSYELIPVSSIGSQSSPYLMGAKESGDFLLKIASSSDPELADMILNKEIVFSK